MKLKGKKLMATVICGLVAPLIFANPVLAGFDATYLLATEVLLNQPGVSYDLSWISQAENVTVRTKEIPVSTDEVEEVPKPQEIITGENSTSIDKGETETVIDAIIYRSHYNPDIAVILSESRYGFEDKYLSVRIQIPTQQVQLSMPIVMVNLTGDMDVAALDMERAKELGWNVKISGGGQWTIEEGKEDEDNDTAKEEEGKEIQRYSYLLEKGDIYIHIMASERISLEKTQVVIRVNNAASLSQGIKDEISDVLVTIGFADSKETALQNADIESRTREWVELAPAIDIDAEKFDWKEAMRIELSWLKDNGVIQGLTDSDISEASSACEKGTAGYNSRIVFENGSWLPYHQTDNPVLIRGLNVGGFPLNAPPGGIETNNRLSNLGGFPIDTLPEGVVTSIEAPATDEGNFPMGFVWAIIGVVVLGVGAFIWLKKLSAKSS